MYDKLFKKNSIKNRFPNAFIFIFFLTLFINVQNFVCEDLTCNKDSSMSSTTCFNNVLKFDTKQYRAGHFVTTKSGDLLIEYSEDDGVEGRGRLFYRITKDGRNYYSDDSPIYEFKINTSYVSSSDSSKYIGGRYESQNILVSMSDDNEDKEYLFSISSYISLTELHDISSTTHYTWLTEDFFSSNYIFSYRYSLLNIAGTKTYFAIFVPFDSYIDNNPNNAQSKYYYIRKFSFTSFGQNKPYNIIASKDVENYNDRIVSGYLLDSYSRLIIFYIDRNSKFQLHCYDFDLNLKNTLYISNLDNANSGEGRFCQSLLIQDKYGAIAYYENGNSDNSLRIRIIKYISDSLSIIFQRNLEQISLTTSPRFNDLIKITDTRLAFVSTNSNRNKLVIYLCDIYDSYSKMDITAFEHGLSYSIQGDKELAAYSYNGYLMFTGSIYTDKLFSILMTFGYCNGEDKFIDISPYLADSNNTDSSYNLFETMMSTYVVDNNIFGYTKLNKAQLICIPDEIQIYQNSIQLINGNTLNEKPVLYQNTNLNKTYQNYSLYFRLYVQEPNYTTFISMATQHIKTDSNGNDITENFESSYNDRIRTFEGRSVRLYFKLCHDYCETCNILGTSLDFQYCLTCLPEYRYDYWNYFGVYPINCVPKNHYNDLETGKLMECTYENSKFYYNTTDGKKYCFKYEYPCPPPYPSLNETTHECLNISLPTTIITTIPTTIITTIPTTILTTIPTTITTTIPTTITTTIPTTITTTIPTTITTTIPTTITTNIPTTVATTLLTTVATTIPTTIATTIPTTIITTIPTTIYTTTPHMPTTIITTIPTTIITTIPKTTVPKVRCNYYLLVEDKCDFTDDSNTEIYEQLKYDVIETYPKGGNSTGVKISNDLYFELTTVENQFLSINDMNPDNHNNLSIIDLKECATILKRENNLPNDTDLIILKLENLALSSKDKSVQYEVYAPGNHTKLDLSVCDKTKIDILYPIELDEETIKVYNDLKGQGYDLFDKNNKFYKDICTPYKSEDGTDVILADRNNDFFAKHEIICQSSCDYSSFSSQTFYVRCVCDVVEKEQIEAEEPKKATTKKDYNSIVDILKYSNYKVLYCYNLVFRGVTFYKNLGSIFTMLYFIGYCISFGFFCYKGLTPLKMEIAKLFKKKRNISNFKFNNDNDKNKAKNINVVSKFKNDSEKDKNKSNLKRSIKNKRVQLIDVDGDEIKDKEKMEREKNMTFSQNVNKENIDKKKYNDNAIKTKNSKEDVPPKRKEVSNNFGEKLIVDKSKNDLNTDKIFDSDVLIYKSNNMNNQKDTKDLNSINKKLNQNEDSSINEDLKTNTKLKEGKLDEKDETKTKRNKNEILSDYELNHLEFADALELDNRIFLRIYWSLLKREHPVIHTFFAWNDFNLFFIKLSNFFFLITTVMSLDALFFSNDAMHNIYKSGGSYNFGYHFVQIVLTIIVYEALQVLLNYLTLTDIDYYKIKAKKDTIEQKEVYNIIQCIKYKIIGYYIFTFLVFLFYWYLNSAFCAVYENTQSIFIADSFLCLLFAFIYPLILYLLPTGLRKISFIFSKTKVLKIVYRISQFIPIF